MRPTPLLLFVACCSSIAPVSAHAADPFELKDGDRVVFVGSTLIESEQRYGYWETMLTSHFPDRNVTFRNLGWSGDTVFGDARAGFETQAEGYRRLKEHVLALKPTVIFIGYGTNESFEGEAGLPRFAEGMNKLLDDLAPTKARIVLLSPLMQERPRPPLPDPTEHNRDVKRYRDRLHKIADERKCCFVDFIELLAFSDRELPTWLTDDGIHLTAFGYWRAGAALESALGLKATKCFVDLKNDGRTVEVEGAKVVSDKALSFQVTAARLPAPPPPTERKRTPGGDWGEQAFRLHGVPDGVYDLAIDGKKALAATAQAFATRLDMTKGPAYDQVEKLRETIIAKNRLYFHRWRPQNETYLFGFRKAEQGKNAKEIPEFDPLVEKLEAEIAKLRKPVTQTWELVRKEEVRK
ncbi:MAG TPA: SGNH/GDSL hydrolase family protein [Gemmataceae bacterium]